MVTETLDEGLAKTIAAYQRVMTVRDDAKKKQSGDALPGPS